MYLPSMKIRELFFSFDMLHQLVPNIDLHIEFIKRISRLMQLSHSLLICKLLDSNSVSQFE